MATSANSVVLGLTPCPPASARDQRPGLRPLIVNPARSDVRLGQWLAVAFALTIALAHWQTGNIYPPLVRTMQLAALWLTAFVFLSRGIGISGRIAAGCAIIYVVHPLSGGSPKAATDSILLAGVVGMPVVGLLCLWSLRTRQWSHSLVLAVAAAVAATLTGGSAILMGVSAWALSPTINPDVQRDDAIASVRPRWSHLVRVCVVVLAVAAGCQASRLGFMAGSDGKAISELPETSTLGILTWVDVHGWFSQGMVELPDALRGGAGEGYLGLTLLLVTWIALGQRNRHLNDRRRIAAIAMTLVLGILWLTRSGPSLHEQTLEAFEQVTLCLPVDARTQNFLGVGLLLLGSIALAAFRFVRVALFDRRRSVLAFCFPVILVVAWWSTNAEVVWENWSDIVRDTRIASACIALLMVTAVATAAGHFLHTRPTAVGRWVMGLLIGSILLGDVTGWRWIEFLG